MRIVELGVERTALLVDDRTGVAEPLPELLGDSLRQARSVLLLRLPGVEQLAELGGDLLPLHLAEVAGGDLLGALDEDRALGDRLVDELLGLLRLLLGGFRQRRGERVEPIAQSCEIADGGGIGRLLDQVRSLLGQVAGRSSACLVALLERLHLEGDVVELADEVGEGLVGSAVGYWPTTRQASPSLTSTVPSSDTRPHSAEVEDAAGTDATGATAAGVGAFAASARRGSGDGESASWARWQTRDSPCAVGPREAERTRLSLVRRSTAGEAPTSRVTVTVS